MHGFADDSKTFIINNNRNSPHFYKRHALSHAISFDFNYNLSRPKSASNRVTPSRPLKTHCLRHTPIDKYDDGTAFDFGDLSRNQEQAASSCTATRPRFSPQFLRAFYVIILLFTLLSIL